MAGRFVFRHFRTRLLAIIVLLVLGLQALVFFTVSGASYTSAVKASNEALQITLASLKVTMASREANLRARARLLSQDFAFKTLIAESDHDTLISAFASYRRRIGADWMFVLGLDGRSMADTLRPDGGEQTVAVGQMMRAIENGDRDSSSIQIVNGRAYQVVMVPLLSPTPVAWVGIGFEITDTLAAELKRQTHTQVTLALREAGKKPVIFSSTLDQDQRRDYQAFAPKATNVTLSGIEHVAIETPLYQTDQGAMEAALQRSLDEALADYRALRWQLGAVFALSTLLAAIAAMFIARLVTRPVQQLAAGAKRISEGQYETIGDIGVQDELGALATSFDAMVHGLIERDKVRAMLGKVVSPKIAEELLSQKIDFSGQEQEVTVLFSDIRSFTTLCEGRPPSAILAMLNTYLTTVSALIDERNGVVDKYIGDAVMALFGAPLGAPDDPQRSLDTALAMLRALPALNAEFARDGWPPLTIGIGIHSGNVVAGNIGSTTRLNYTVLGDTVNLAARLESLCKYYGVPLIVSGATMQRCHGIVFRELDLVRVKGKSEIVAIYHAVDLDDNVDAAQRDELAIHAKAVAAYRAGRFQEALDAFNAGRQDALAELYRGRCTRYLAQPPGDDWNGVTTFTQ
jgi:adenylate cyclase